VKKIAKLNFEVKHIGFSESRGHRAPEEDATVAIKSFILLNLRDPGCKALSRFIKLQNTDMHF
jgi:hypothetical protein